MPPIAKLLSIFTKIIKPKESLIKLSISANQTSPTIKFIVQQHYDTINCQRYGCTINNKLSGVANKGPYATFRRPTTGQRLTNIVPSLINSFGLNLVFWSYFIVNLSQSYLFIDFMKFYQVFLILTIFFFCFSDVVAINM